MRNARIFGSSMLAMGALLLCGLPMAAQDTLSPSSVRQAIYFDMSPPLRELAKLPTPGLYGFHQADQLHTYPVPGEKMGPVVDPVEQSFPGGRLAASLGLNLLGVGNGFPNYNVGVAPPDTNAAVGDTQVWNGGDGEAGGLLLV